VHTQYSILQATSEIPALIARAKGLNMPAIAMTDHGNMMAAFNFVKEAIANDIKPIVGCEFNVCQDRRNKSRKDDGFTAYNRFDVIGNGLLYEIEGRHH